MKKRPIFEGRPGLFVSGAGTGVGKTRFTAFLAKRLTEAGLVVRVVKPVQTGGDDDAGEIGRIAALPPNQNHTLLTAEAPLAPLFCFDPFPYDRLLEELAALPPADFLLVEGAGGLMVPLSWEKNTVDLVRDLGLPLGLVVPDRLGALSDSLVHLTAARGLGITHCGLALNRFFSGGHIEQLRHLAVLERLVPGDVWFLFDALGVERLPDFIGRLI